MPHGALGRSAVRFIAALLATLIGFSLLSAPAGAATISPPDEVELLRLHNETRAANGLAPLAYDVAAEAVARDWARTMADSASLRHNPNLPQQTTERITPDWTRVGENVGRGPDVARINTGFLNSSSHRANIVGGYNRAGVGGARDASGQLWVVVVFLQGPPLASAPRAPSPAAWAPFATPEALADQQYRDFLSRPGDAAGINHWATQLRTGRISAPGEIEFFLSSPEFAGMVAPVVRLHFAAFGRIPDQAGLQRSIDQSRAGTPLANLARSLADSAEFRNRYSSLANRAFVDALYRSVLGRPADQAGLDRWVGGLDAGTLTRGDVLAGLAQSNEHIWISHGKVLTTMAYVGMLRRSPDQGGFDYWVARINRGGSVGELVGGFLASQEYARRFA